jgi:6,7-dimethyl-8-ribityllumazine synthase
MSSALPPQPRIIGPRVRVCIVAAKYNEQFADALVDNAVDEIGELMPSTRIDLIRVPGAFEIPVAVAAVLDREKPAAVLALGVIIKGATAHADLVACSVTEALQRLAVQYRIPIINEVLLLEDEKQAYARCIGANLNRGKEAARAAASMVDVFHELDRTMPKDSDKTKKIRHA